MTAEDGLQFEAEVVEFTLTDDSYKLFCHAYDPYSSWFSGLERSRNVSRRPFQNDAI